MSNTSNAPLDDIEFIQRTIQHCIQEINDLMPHFDGSSSMDLNTAANALTNALIHLETASTKQ